MPQIILKNNLSGQLIARCLSTCHEPQTYSAAVDIFEEVGFEVMGESPRWLMVTLEIGMMSSAYNTSCLCRRKWQPTPVFLPGESQGRGSLVGCRLWGCAESDTTEAP